MPAALPAPSGSPERSPARLRLPPEVRSSQILDAALALFSEHGFAAARMDDIARRCGLSKGGLYAHFASKDEVFEALIARALAAPELALPPLPAPLDLAQWVDWLLEQVHQRFADPQLRATLRLLVAEGERVSDLVAQWHAQVVQPFVEALGQWFAVGQAPMPTKTPPLLAREPWLALAPAVHALFMQLILPPGLAYPPARVREAHRELLLRLLQQP